MKQTLKIIVYVYVNSYLFFKLWTHFWNLGQFKIWNEKKIENTKKMMTRLVLGMVFGRVLDPMIDGPEFGRNGEKTKKIKQLVLLL